MVVGAMIWVFGGFVTAAILMRDQRKHGTQFGIGVLLLLFVGMMWLMIGFNSGGLPMEPSTP